MMDGSEGRDIVMTRIAGSAHARGRRPRVPGGHDGRQWPHRPAGSVSQALDAAPGQLDANRAAARQVCCDGE
jgi:hypothetical protein